LSQTPIMANQYWAGAQTNYPQPPVQLEHEFPYPSDNLQQPPQFSTDANDFQFQGSFSSNDYQSGYNSSSYPTSGRQQGSGDSFGFAPSIQSSMSPEQQYSGSSALQQQQQAYNSATYNFQPSHPPLPAMNSGDSLPRPFLSASPPPMQPQPSTSAAPRQSYYHTPQSNLPPGRPSKTKRPRIPDPIEDLQDDDGDDAHDSKDKTKP
jgi:hypothetical protein